MSWPKRVGRMPERRPRVHAIIGPTGTGKTARAGRTALRLGAPVIVADRLQCFADLPVTSGRDFGHEAAGVSRWFLGERVVADGDFPARAACRTLCYLVGKLAVDGSPVVVEGGSISLLTELAHCRPELPFDLAFEVLRIPDALSYQRKLLTRARRMLRPDDGGPGMAEELAAAWRTREQRDFVASVKGLDVIIDWCAANGTSPDTLDGCELDPATLGVLAGEVARVHVEHGWDQQRRFIELANGSREVRQ